MKSFTEYINEILAVSSESYSQEDVEKRLRELSRDKKSKVKYLVKQKDLLGHETFLIKSVVSSTPEGGKEKQQALVLFDKDGKAILFFYYRPLKDKRIQERRIGVSKDLQGQGLASKFYDALLSSGYGIYSDDAQTPAGKNLWLKLYRMYKNKYKFFHFNAWQDKFYPVSVKNNKFISTFNKNFDVYDNDEAHLLFVSKKEMK